MTTINNTEAARNLIKKAALLNMKLSLAMHKDRAEIQSQIEEVESQLAEMNSPKADDFINRTDLDTEIKEPSIYCYLKHGTHRLY